MSGYDCLLCEGANGPVTIITTSLVTGATASSCSACYPVALVGALATELGLDGNRLYSAIERFSKAEEKAGRLSPGPEVNGADPAAAAASTVSEPSLESGGGSDES